MERRGGINREKAVESEGDEWRGEGGIKTDRDGERMCEEVCERGSERVCVRESKTKCRSSWGSAAAAAAAVTVDE